MAPVSDLLGKDVSDPITLSMTALHPLKAAHKTYLAIHSSHKSSEHLRELAHLGLWPILPRNWDIELHLSRLAQYQPADLMYQFGYETIRSMHCSACQSGLQDRMSRLLNEVSQMVTGLCIDCIRSGVEQGHGHNCRMKH